MRSAIAIACSAETENPGGGRVSESGSTSLGIGWPPNGDCWAGSSSTAAPAPGAASTSPASATTSAGASRL